MIRIKPKYQILLEGITPPPLLLHKPLLINILPAITQVVEHTTRIVVCI